LHEVAWNAHPVYCRTVITNPGYMKDNFTLKIETMCLPDRGDSENAHELNPEQLQVAFYISITTDRKVSQSVFIVFSLEKWST
jgi:hypothetical protein